MRPARATACLLAGMLTMASATSAASVNEVRVPPGGSYQVRITSLKEARYRTTIPQQYDFSCGSAATATLLSFQYGHPVSEEDVFVRMYNQGDQAKIQREGFSMLDMRRYLASMGYDADGFELPLEKLAEEGVPAIVLLNDRGYRHFVVVKGLLNGRVLLGDPARGTRAMPRSRFEALWDNRVLFVIHSHRSLARFNQGSDWRTAPPAPLSMGIQRDGLRGITVPRRGPGDI
ncbi:C39 family peptidase [Lysobacter sp. SG-8]|uniref:C39 family peptidase n=1 Tax=Marilutibacter penaei TaxID=2759900 RepID=A0A7W3U5G2_9GAMM|nr:C39 family peptidase [Lysobacter penaei]MBB1089301.1 C39 family peptidase [Lysobacter penaei]